VPINGRFEHPRSSAFGFRNLSNYIARSLLETDGFRPQLHPALGYASFAAEFLARLLFRLSSFRSAVVAHGLRR